jgi:hypothetical protein
LVRKIGDIMSQQAGYIQENAQMQGYKEQINERMAQERRSQLTKIMQENYKMLERIKKCRSQYAIEGGGTLSQRKRAQLAEKLAEGLVRIRGSKERQKVKV